MSYLEKSEKQAFDKRAKEKKEKEDWEKKCKENAIKREDLKKSLISALKEFDGHKGIKYVEGTASNSAGSIFHLKEKLLSFEVGWKSWDVKYSDDMNPVDMDGPLISIRYHDETIQEYDFDYKSRLIPKISEHYGSEDLVNSCMEEVANYLSKYF